MMRKKYLVRDDSVLQQLAYGFKRREQKPSEFPWVGFSLPGVHTGRVNSSLRWATLKERITLLSAVVVAWRAAVADEIQARELIDLFGGDISRLFGKQLVFTIKKKRKTPWRFIRGWYVDNGSPLEPLRGNILFTITCLGQNQVDEVIQALKKSPAGIEVVDIAQLTVTN